MSLCDIYITNSNEKEARKVAKHLLDKRLVACVNIFPIKSLYWWHNKIADEKEFALIAKTTSDKYDKVKEEVKKIHSHTIPCIIKIEIEADKEYADWLIGEVK